MSEKTNAAKTNDSNPTITISGLIKSSKQVGISQKDHFPIIENLILLPSVDNYSYPPRLCVKSRSRFGNEGDEITVKAMIFCRSYEAEVTDKETGEIKKVTRYNHELWAVQ